MGGPTHSKMFTHRAASEETLGGEKWLKIIDVEMDTVVYFLNTKVDGYTSIPTIALIFFASTRQQ